MSGLAAIMEIRAQEVKPQIVRGRLFSIQDLQTIKSIVEDYYDKGRTRASIEICEKLDWRQPNGWLKDRACREVLRILENQGYVSLPPLRSNPVGNSRRGTTPSTFSGSLDNRELVSINFDEIKISQVKGTKDESLWNWLVSEYHYLGFSVLVGRTLKYIAWHKNQVVGAWSLSDCAWSLESRDSLLRRAGLNIENVRSCVINNSRFLIMPWIRVPNLASCLLSFAAKRAKVDWKAYYSITPSLIETFVETEMFLGTCYKAANWLLIGKTRGYRKVGKAHQNSQTSKAIYVYPLSRKLRAQIIKMLENNSSCPT
jgi:hypothetical protein